MVKKYRKKGERGKWNQKDVKGAIQVVKEAQMIAYGAAKHIQIPRETLRGCVSGKVSLDAMVESPPTLSQAEEAEIVETCQVFGE